MGCGPSKKSKAESRPGLEDPTSLASETPFTVSEVESLYELFRKLSSSLVDDGLIHKEELQLAFFKNSSKDNLFLDRVFYLFDLNGNGHIEFSESVRSLAIFHPKTPDAVKASYAFRLYDVRQTGYIEREELKETVLALFNESELNLSDEVVEMIVNKTFAEADAKSDGRIDEEEWKDYVATNQSLLKNMTLPYLMDISIAFPSFILNNETKQSEL